jgi:hypothetical protein
VRYGKIPKDSEKDLGLIINLYSTLMKKIYLFAQTSRGEKSIFISEMLVFISMAILIWKPQSILTFTCIVMASLIGSVFVHLFLLSTVFGVNSRFAKK